MRRQEHHYSDWFVLIGQPGLTVDWLKWSTRGIFYSAEKIVTIF